ncbi:METTL5 family protein [Candidatus Woesearchaeota archaeon]|nr:METTL5 family protein [Candidatus Woesearchaeota archaeon]
MSKTQLAIILSRLKVFENPKVQLEQYPTDSEVAADILWKAYMLGDIEDKVIADFGAGTGILGIGCLNLNCKKVLFVEKDEDAIYILKNNLQDYEDYKILNMDVSEFDKNVDVVVMNPPFGVKNRKADKIFVEKAFSCGKVLYYIGKVTSKSFIESISKDFEKKITHFWEYDMKLKNTMKFHTKKNKEINIGCWRIE